MTYLVITSQINIEDDSTNSLISTLWDKEISPDSLLNNPDFHMIDGREQNSVGIEEIKELLCRAEIVEDYDMLMNDRPDIAIAAG